MTNGATGEPVVVRASSLPDYVDCPRRFAARHLKALVLAAGYEVRTMGPAHVGAAIGSGLHAAAEVTLQRKAQDGTLGSDADALAAAIEVFDARAAEEGCAWDNVTTSVNTAQKQLARMSVSWRTEIAPAITPSLIEERLEAEFSPSLILSGQPDILSGSTVRDIKSSHRGTWPQYQLGAYALALQAHGHEVTVLLQDRVPRTPLAKEQPLAETTRMDLRAAVQDAHDALRRIDTDVAEWLRRVKDPRGDDPRGAFLANPASALCSDRWCSAWGTPLCTSHRPLPSKGVSHE